MSFSFSWRFGPKVPKALISYYVSASLLLSQYFLGSLMWTQQISSLFIAWFWFWSVTFSFLCFGHFIALHPNWSHELSELLHIYQSYNSRGLSSNRSEIRRVLAMNLYKPYRVKQSTMSCSKQKDEDYSLIQFDSQAFWNQKQSHHSSNPSHLYILPLSTPLASYWG